MRLLIVLIVLIVLFFYSCSVRNKTINDMGINITITKTECGSYSVTNNNELIGYVVKPFYVEVENKEIYITQFENLTKAKYFHYYNKFNRIYVFVKNRAGDTTLDVLMLSTKQLGLIPNAQCEEQSLDVYNRVFKKRKNTDSFTYNCSKGRLRISGDPD